MYINQKEHILSKVICQTAIVRLVGEMANSAARMIMNRQQGLQPDMLNVTITNFASIVSAIQIIVIIALFYKAYTRITHIRSVVPKDDFVEMAKLQEELGGNKISSLSSYSIVQLLQLWAAILIGVQVVYDVTSRAYQSFIEQMSLLIDFSDANIASAFVSLYNNTHGFKYIGMFVAISLGVFITGVFLKDSTLEIAAFAIMGCFMLAFAILQMRTVTVLNRTVGIVWTSVIFHLIQTVGLFVFSIYLSKKYKGL